MCLVITPKDVIDRVGLIVDIAGDFEAAHGAEIKLHQDVLESIAGGKCEEARRCAKLALQTSQIQFKRVKA